MTSGEPRIEAGLHDVVALLRQRLPGIESIQLVGSLARGEALRGAADAETWIANDVDFIISGGSQPAAESLGSVARACAGKLHTPVVDLGFKVLSDVPHLPLNQFNADVRYASRCLWGSDLRQLLPDYDLAQMPKSEALTVALNRLQCLLEAHPERSTSAEYRRIQRMKAIEGTVEAHLILEGRYTPSYRAKVTALESHTAAPPTLVRQALWALSHRLSTGWAGPEPTWGEIRSQSLEMLACALRATSRSRPASARRLALGVLAAPMVPRGRGVSSLRPLRHLPHRLAEARVSAAQVLVAAAAPPAPARTLGDAAALLLTRPGSFSETLEKVIRAWRNVHYPADAS